MQSGDDEETLSRSQQHHMSYPSTMRSRAQNEHHSIRRVSDADLVLSEDMSLKDRQQAINEVHPFGLRLWKPALYKKSRGIESITYQSVHETPVRSYGRRFFFDWHLYPANVAWTILFGWWMAIIYVLASIILLILTGIFSKIGLGYAKMILSLASYIFWPFGRYIERKKTNSNEVTDLTTSSNFETSPLLTSSRYDSDFRSFGDSQRWSFGSFVYYAVFYLILAPMHISVSAICWFFVVSIPMAKLNYVLLGHLHREPCCLRVVGPSLSSGSLFSGEILICTYKAFGLQYIKYTYDGINILFINLLPVVCFALVDGYLIGPATHHTGIGNPFFIFVLCLLSVIPLAYYIGMAVASVSSQSSFGFGAVVNASFGSIVEIILYAIAITEGKGVLVEGAIIGSFLGTLLLLPGLSMIAGGIGPWKEQRFNVKSASVSTVLLIMALIGAFTPTIFYSIYGSYELKCLSCPPVSRNASMAGLDNEQLLKCSGCTFSLPQNPGTDPVYVERIKPLMYLCACVLPSAYVVGLLFTLRTHVKQIYCADSKRDRADSVNRFSSAPNNRPNSSASGSNNLLLSNHGSSDASDNRKMAKDSVDKNQTNERAHSGAGHHDAPEWSKRKSIAILLISTVVFSLLAELLVDSVDEVIASLRLDPKFLGLTVFAIVPSFTEFMNAIMFASYGNVALSLEIGSAYLIQVALIQIPCLVAFSAFYAHLYGIPDTLEKSFTLIFPKWDCFTVFFGVFLLSYTYIEGKSNYFKGSILTLSYLVMLMSFYFAPI